MRRSQRNEPFSAYKTAKGLVFQVVLRHASQQEICPLVGASAADFTIEPDVSDMDIAAFQEAPRFAELGRRETESVIGQLKEMLHRLDSRLFP